jgi:hypothetical protein
MNKNEIIEMARQSGMMTTVLYLGRNLELLTNFAKLVTEHEREACAKACEKHAEVYASLPKTLTTDASWAACIDSRDAIRARGKA